MRKYIWILMVVLFIVWVGRSVKAASVVSSGTFQAYTSLHTGSGSGVSAAVFQAYTTIDRLPRSVFQSYTTIDRLPRSVFQSYTTIDRLNAKSPDGFSYIKFGNDQLHTYLNNTVFNVESLQFGGITPDSLHLGLGLFDVFVNSGINITGPYMKLNGNPVITKPTFTGYTTISRLNSKSPSGANYIKIDNTGLFLNGESNIASPDGNTRMFTVNDDITFTVGTGAAVTQAILTNGAYVASATDTLTFSGDNLAEFVSGTSYMSLSSTSGFYLNDNTGLNTIILTSSGLDVTAPYLKLNNNPVITQVSATTGSRITTLGTNSPSNGTTPYKWIKTTFANGTSVYIPGWR
jgi:hypothetical protein